MAFEYVLKVARRAEFFFFLRNSIIFSDFYSYYDPRYNVIIRHGKKIVHILRMILQTSLPLEEILMNGKAKTRLYYSGRPAAVNN